MSFSSPGPSTEPLKLLNLGCGAALHPKWVNVDLVSNSPLVLAQDVTRGIQFPDATFDAVYSSHVLEHLTPEQGERLLREAFRVLRPQGVLRLVVPDLESIARLYLQKLERAIGGDTTAEADYDWMMLEFLDQTVRSSTGGGMKAYLFGDSVPNLPWVLDRLGEEGEHLLKARQLPQQTLGQRLRTLTPARLFSKLQRQAALSLMTLVGGSRYHEALQEGLFRHSGEIHRWMYDRYSLGRLMTKASFRDIRICGSSESRIPDFSSYSLDTNLGRTRKPDSLFIEGIK